MTEHDSRDSDGHDHDGGAGHEGGAGHAHDHSQSDERHLRIALGLLVAFMLGEVVVAFAAGSLVLLSDAGHMLSDVGALAAALWALRVARRPAEGAWTYGWKRAEILSAAGNGVTLLVVSGIVSYEAIRRLIHPPAVDGLPVLVVALVGVAVNIAATWVLARGNRDSLNIKGSVRAPAHRPLRVHRHRHRRHPPPHHWVHPRRRDRLPRRGRAHAARLVGTAARFRSDPARSRARAHQHL